MNVVLNIGLNVKASSQIAGHVALQILGANDLLIHKHRLVQSDTEPTLVVEVSKDPLVDFPLHGCIRRTARDLQQEVIACWKPARQKGVMLGATIDLDDAWGAFNPELFFLLDGTRLAQPGAAIAA